MSELLTKRGKVEALRKRVEAIDLALKDTKRWKPDFFKKNKKFDTAYWSEFLKNMMAGKTTDEDLIKALEKYVKTIKSDPF